MTDPQKPIFVGGGNGSPAGIQDEVEHGKDLARRYRCEFVDLKNFHIQHELFRKIKVDLMFRYNFVPLEEKPDGRLLIAIADPKFGHPVRNITMDNDFAGAYRDLADRFWNTPGMTADQFIKELQQKYDEILGK